MSKKVINHVYLDMDGVISNFDFETVNELKSKDKWQHDGFPKFVKNKGFEKLPKLGDADMLIDYLTGTGVKITILSSAGDAGDDYDEIVRQKKSWLAKHNIKFPAIIVKKKDLKKEYASKHALLIDDTKKNCKDFDEEGGNAIVHRSALHTINHITENFFLKGNSDD